MNKKMMIILLISIGIIIVLVSNINCPYKENILYSQSQLNGYNEKVMVNNNLINRSEAIEIATNLLSNTLGVDLSEGNPQMFVDVYRDTKFNDVYDWNILWSKEGYSGSYGVEIKSDNGEILNVYLNIDMPVKNTNISSELTKDDLLDIIKPFAEELKIDLNSYDLNIKSVVKYNTVGIKTPYKYCTFTNGSDKFRIIIDSRAEAIVSYTKNAS